MKLCNFRGYQEETLIEFGNLTVFVGKNDIGKSSVLEALDIFFNDGKGSVKIEKDDINKHCTAAGNREICISVCFSELPERLVIDSSNETALRSEYLLNSNSQLEVIKRYPNAGTAKVFIKAVHPTNSKCRDLLIKKDTELRAIIDQEGIGCADRVKKAIMRASIWEFFEDDLQLDSVELDVTKGDTKTIWDKMQNYLPTYTLFQSDRKNCDGDCEVQDPLKEAVREILSDVELRRKLSEVAQEVERKLQKVSNRTLEKLRELNAEVANSLNPVIPPADSLKWTDVFKNVSISGDEDIPINKRGSGTKRLILLSFFRAEAERRRVESSSTGIIYAIEEPETSQHTENQKLLTRAFLSLAESQSAQIVLTTHSANVVKELNFPNLRLVTNQDGNKLVSTVMPGQLPYPSLNEVNYLAFTEISEEYHNELYGFIEAEGHMGAYRLGKPTVQYIKLLRNGTQVRANIILTEYIRHQIHHPENHINIRFSPVQLRESIDSMRDFIQTMPR